MLQDFYSKLSNQEKTILYWTLGAIVIAVFDFLFYQPVSSKLKMLDVQIAQTKDDIKRDVRYLAYKEKVFKEHETYRIYTPDEQKTEDQIFSAFLGTVENFAREVEVNPGKLNPGDVVHKKGYAQYFANMECSGKFDNIIKLIHKIDTTSNLLKVVKINIVGKKSSSDEVIVIMKISKLTLDAKSDEDKLKSEKSASESQSAVGVKGVSLSGPLGTSAVGNNESKTAKGVSSNSAGVSGVGTDEGASSGGFGTGGKQAKDGQVNSGGESSGGGNGDGVAGSTGGADGGSGGGKSGAGRAGDESGGTAASASGSGSDQTRDWKVNSDGEDNGGGSGGASGGNSGGVNRGGAKSDDDGDAVGGGADDSDDGQATAGGSSGSGGSSKRKDGKIDKEKKSIAKDKPQPEKKTAAPLDKVASGERMKVKSIESLWNDFWGIKSKPSEEKSETEKKTFNHDEYKTEDELKPNVFDRMLDKKDATKN